MFDNTRISINYRMRMNIVIHQCIWSYQHIIADFDFADNCSIHPNPHIIAYCWHALAFSSILLTNGHTLCNVDMRAYNGIRIYDDAVRMTNIQTWAAFYMKGKLTKIPTRLLLSINT